jgi:hypothetical protein
MSRRPFVAAADATQLRSGSTLAAECTATARSARRI